MNAISITYPKIVRVLIAGPPGPRGDGEAGLAAWGLTLGDDSSGAQAANGVAFHTMFDYMASPEGADTSGRLILPPADIHVSLATALELNTLRSWEIIGSGSGGISGSPVHRAGTRIYVHGGGADYFLRLRTCIDFKWRGIYLNLTGTHGMAGALDLGANDAPAVSSFLVTLQDASFTYDTQEPSFGMIYDHSDVSSIYENVWITPTGHFDPWPALVFGSGPTDSTLSSGSSGQITMINCLIYGDIVLRRVTSLKIIGGQHCNGNVTTQRDAQIQVAADATLVAGIELDNVGIGATGNRTAPYIPAGGAVGIQGLRISSSCLVGRFSVVAEADLDSSNWEISPTFHSIGNSKPATGLLRILSSCTGDHFRSETPPDPLVSYVVKDERTYQGGPLTLEKAQPRVGVLHNPAFQIWRRGTSFTPTTQMFGADRWKFRRAGNQTGSTYSRQAGILGTQYAMRMQRDAGNAALDILYLGQQIFTADSLPLAGRPLFVSAALSPGANFSAATGSVIATVHTGTGIDEAGSVSGGFATGNVSINLPATAHVTAAGRYDFGYVILPADATEVLVVVRWTPVGTAGAADYVDVAFINSTVGRRPSPFVYPGEVEERKRTSPFCQKSFRFGTTPAQNVGVSTGEVRGVITQAGAALNYMPIQFREGVMWGVPTVTLYNPAGANAEVRNITDGADCSGTAATNLTEAGMELSFTGSAGGAVGEHVGIHYLAVAGV